MKMPSKKRGNRRKEDREKLFGFSAIPKQPEGGDSEELGEAETVGKRRERE